MTTTMQALWPYLVDPAAAPDDSVCSVSAHGHRIQMADGSEVLDGTSGLWNVNIGYGDPVIAEAIARAAHDASYLGVFRYENLAARQAAEDLLDLAGRDRYSRVMFSTSGGAANDLVVKIVRQVALLDGHRTKNLVVSMDGSYHGLTFGGFALTGENLGQRVYGVDQRSIRHVAVNDIGALHELMAREGDRVAGVIVEPVQGSGTVVLQPDYLEALGRMREEHGFLLVADEVATGFGRTGPCFATHSWQLDPDLLVTSKGLTNGTCAAAAVLVSPAVARRFEHQRSMVIHAETQGGTAITASAISATIARFHELDAFSAGARVGAHLGAALDRLVLELPEATGTTGTGCFRSVQLAGSDGEPMSGEEITDLVKEIRRGGAIVHPGPGSLQLIPSLTFSAVEVDELVGCVRGALLARRPCRQAVAS